MHPERNCSPWHKVWHPCSIRQPSGECRVYPSESRAPRRRNCHRKSHCVWNCRRLETSQLLQNRNQLFSGCPATAFNCSASNDWNIRLGFMSWQSTKPVRKPDFYQKKQNCYNLIQYRSFLVQKIFGCVLSRPAWAEHIALPSYKAVCINFFYMDCPSKSARSYKHRSMWVL